MRELDRKMYRRGQLFLWEDKKTECKKIIKNNILQKQTENLGEKNRIYSCISTLELTILHSRDDYVCCIISNTKEICYIPDMVVKVDHSVKKKNTQAIANAIEYRSYNHTCNSALWIMENQDWMNYIFEKGLSFAKLWWCYDTEKDVRDVRRPDT